MKKNRAVLLMAAAITALVAGIVCISVTRLDSILSGFVRNLLGITGIGLLLLGILLTIVCFWVEAEQNEDIKREEQDERNCMIRGKAAENAMLFTSIVFLVTECVFLLMGSGTEAAIVAVAMCFCVMVWVGWICYYQKKY